MLAAVIGTGARLRAYLGARSLWYDELLLTLNIVERSWLDLAKPLDSAQSAPILFLWVERVAVSLAGPSELALRAMPLACGIATPVGIWLVGRRLLGPRDALWASIFASLSPSLIYYSNEVKQYGIDAFVTLVLVALTWHVIENPAAPGRWRRFAAGSTVLLGLSQPVVFTLVGATGALALSARVRSTPRWLINMTIVGLIWGATFCGLYFGIYRAAAHSPALLRNWSGTFLGLHAPDLRLRAYHAARSALTSPLPLALDRIPMLFVGLVFLVGAGRAAKVHGASAGALLVLPQLGLVAAAALGKYPIADRFLLVTAPLTFLAFGSFLALVADVSPAPTRSIVGAALGGLALVLGASPAIAVLADPPPREESRVLIREAQRLRAGEPIYISWDGTPAWSFYTAAWSAGHSRRGNGLQDSANNELFGRDTGMLWDATHGWDEPAPSAAWVDGEVARMASAARPNVWLFSSHHLSVVDSLLSAAHKAGASFVYGHVEPGAVLYKLRFPDRPR